MNGNEQLLLDYILPMGYCRFGVNPAQQSDYTDWSLSVYMLEVRRQLVNLYHEMKIV